MQQRKIPLRRCTGCNESKPKKELVRVVRDKDGAVSLDLTGKKAGRGLCEQNEWITKVSDFLSKRSS